MIKVELLTIKGSVSIQLRDYTAAKEALKGSIKIYNRHNPVGDGLKTTTSQAYLASLAAAQGEYEESMSLFWKLWLLVSSSHFNDGRGDHARRFLQIHVSILAAKVATLVGKYDEADDMLGLALARFDETMDNPVFHRAILHASGNLHYAKGVMGVAKDCYQVCVHSWRFGTVMHVNQVDEERTISIYHRLAVMDVKDEKARAAR
jgi:tetratricopeptide (TPR) repeat protein